MSVTTISTTVPPYPTPSQSVPPVNAGSNLFSKDWWLFFNFLNKQRAIAAAGGGALAIVYDFEGAPSGGEVSNAYDVNELREGDLFIVSLSAKTAPTTAPLIVNPAFRDPNTGTLTNILTIPLQLAVGQAMPTYSNAFQVPMAVLKGMQLVNVIVQAGGAVDITTTIVIVQGSGAGGSTGAGVLLTPTDLQAITDAVTAQVQAGIHAAALVLAEPTQVASNVAQLDFKNWYDAASEEYEIHINNLVAAANDCHLRLECSTDGGATFDTAANYGWSVHAWIAGADGDDGQNSGANAMILLYKQKNTASWSGNATFKLFSPGSTNYKLLRGETVEFAENSALEGYDVVGGYLQAAKVNGLRFRFTTVGGGVATNILSGSISIYKVAK